MTTKSIDVPLNKLIVNPENYRFESVDNEITAIKIMLETHNKAIKELLKDILENGLNPLDRLLIFEKNNYYIVLEGNRRITALKIMQNVEILKDIDLKYFTEYSKLLKNTKKNFNMNEISCVITDDIADSNKWIGLKHTGSNGGKGTIPWNTTQKRRFLDNTTFNRKSSFITTLYSYIKSIDCYDDAIKQNLHIIPITTLERLLTDPYVRENIGIDIRKNIIYKLYPDNELSKPLKKILNDLINKKIVVTDIYTKSHRVDYLETFNKDDFPDYSKKLSVPIKLSNTLNINNIPLNANTTSSSDNSSIATNSPDSSSVATNSSDNSSVATNSPDSSSIATNISDNSSVATNSPDSSSIATNSSDNSSVATNSSDSSSIATNSSDNSSVATNIFNANTNTTGIKRDNPDINKRKYLIPSTFHAKINVPRIQQIYKELKRLEVAEYPNSVSVLFRVFFELTIDEYIEQIKLKGITNNDKLNKKVQACLDDLKTKNLIDKYKAKPINTAISNNDSLFSINTFNSYVHNKHMIPDALQLKNTWNQFEIFISCLLNSIAK